MKVGTDGVLLGAWCQASSHAHIPEVHPDETCRVSKILDVGCGTGVISLMLAQRFPNAMITGVEIDPQAAREARENFDRSPWSDRLTVVEGDFKSLFGTYEESPFDLIVSNPPFFTNGELSPDNARLTARHESGLQLQSLIDISGKIIAENGSLCLVLPYERADELEWLAVAYRFSLVRLVKVSTVPRKPPRRLLAELVPLSANYPAPNFSSLCIHDENGGFSQEYTTLLKSFYLKF